MGDTKVSPATSSTVSNEYTTNSQVDTQAKFGPDTSELEVWYLTTLVDTKANWARELWNHSNSQDSAGLLVSWVIDILLELRRKVSNHAG